MARFFLNIRHGDDVIRDSTVYHFPTAQDARDAAVQSMREMIIRQHADFDGKEIEIADATGHRIARVSSFDTMIPVARYH